MKTNIKNGAFIYGYVPVDTGKIKLGDAETGEGIKYTTRADDMYPVIAETDENGIVNSLVIEVSRFNTLFDNDDTTIIAEDDIINHGNETLEEFKIRMNNIGMEVGEPVNMEDATRKDLLEIIDNLSYDKYSQYDIWKDE